MFCRNQRLLVFEIFAALWKQFWSAVLLRSWNNLCKNLVGILVNFWQDVLVLLPISTPCGITFANLQRSWRTFDNLEDNSMTIFSDRATDSWRLSKILEVKILEESSKILKDFQLARSNSLQDWHRLRKILEDLWKSRKSSRSSKICEGSSTYKDEQDWQKLSPGYQIVPKF